MHQRTNSQPNVNCQEMGAGPAILQFAEENCERLQEPMLFGRSNQRNQLVAGLSFMVLRAD